MAPPGLSLVMGPLPNTLDIQQIAKDGCHLLSQLDSLFLLVSEPLDLFQGDSDRASNLDGFQFPAFDQSIDGSLTDGKEISDFTGSVKCFDAAGSGHVLILFVLGNGSFLALQLSGSVPEFSPSPVPGVIQRVVTA